MYFNFHSKLCYVALLCTIFCLTIKAQHKYLLVIQPKDLQDIIEQSDVCSKEAGFPPTDFKKLVKWPISDARASKELFECICRKTGYTDDDGHMILEKFLAMKLVHATREDILQLITECNMITLDDPVETAYAVGACLHAACAFTVEKKTE